MTANLLYKCAVLVGKSCNIARSDLQKWPGGCEQGNSVDNFWQPESGAEPAGIRELRGVYDIAPDRHGWQEQVFAQWHQCHQQANPGPVLFYTDECQQSPFLDHAGPYHQSAEYESAWSKYIIIPRMLNLHFSIEIKSKLNYFEFLNQIKML